MGKYRKPRCPKCGGSNEVQVLRRSVGKVFAKCVRCSARFMVAVPTKGK